MRAADLRFALDCLAVMNRGGHPDAQRRPVPRGLRGSLGLTRTGAFGHSRGGAAAAAVMDRDARVRAGADLDASWSAFWDNLRGRRRCLRLADAEHLPFTDVVALVPQLGGALPPPVGTIPADRAVAGVRATVRAFFDAQLRGCPDTSHVLPGASPRCPDIRHVAG